MDVVKECISQRKSQTQTEGNMIKNPARKIELKNIWMS